MKFTVNTKPLRDSLNLGVINNNISKFHLKSTMIQVVATKNSLILNLESPLIYSEIQLKGAGDSSDSAVLFVDSLLLKQLVSTLESSTVILDFQETSLVLMSGKSKFTLPVVSDADMRLTPPDVSNLESAQKIHKDSWKFIKDHQMYAVAMSFVTPVYTYLYLREDGRVFAGDFDNSLFTLSNSGKDIKESCLIKDTIVNLFNAIPEESQLMKTPKGTYVIKVSTDSYEFITEFTPKHESDPDTGDYKSDLIVSTMSHTAETTLEVPTAPMMKALSQADLLASSGQDIVSLICSNQSITLKDDNIDCEISAKGSTNFAAPVVANFKTSLLKSVISSMGETTIFISPVLSAESTPSGVPDVNGVVFFTEAETVVLGCVE